MYHHVLRHSLGTNAIKTKTFSVAELQKFMGHSDITTTMVYVTLAGADLKMSAKQFGDYTDTKK